MIFPAPIFLYLLPLAALPILFHLVLKRKKRTVVFSTLMFFHRTDPKLNSRRKIRQWLLLAARILLIMFILLALSRPQFATSANLGGKIAVVVIVDNSGSMNGSSNDGKEKLQCAAEGARRLISELDKGCQAAVVPLVDDPVVEVTDSLTSNKEFLLASIAQIRPTEATGDVDRALTRAFSLLHAGTTKTGTVHIFTDLQQTEWAETSGLAVSPGRWSRYPRRQAGANNADAAAAGITVCFHKIKSKMREQANVAITAVQFPEERILPQRSYNVGLVLQNDSDAAADVQVNSVDSKGSHNTEKVTLERGTFKTAEIEVTPDTAGYHWVRAWIEGDGFAADNAAGIGLFCEETATVLFAGAREEFGVLPLALSPFGQGQFTGMVTQFCPPVRLREIAAKRKPILIAMTWTTMQSMAGSAAWLRGYVEGGGNLLVLPSTTVERRFVSGQLPDWLGAKAKPLEVHVQGVSLQTLDRTTGFWHPVREAAPARRDSDWEPGDAYMFFPLELGDEFMPLFGVNSQKVVLAQKNLGTGRIYVSGMAFAPRWSALPSTGLFVVVAQRIATSGTSSAQQRVLSLVAGERPHGVRMANHEVKVASLVGDSADWQGKEQDVPVFPKAGVYLLTAGDSQYCISVRASDKEGLDKFLQGSQVPAMGRIAHYVFDYNEAEDFEQYRRYQARTVELYLPLLLLATLALLAEGLLGSPKPVRAGRGANLEKAPEVQKVSAEAAQDDKGQLASLANTLSRSVRSIVRRSVYDKATRRSAS